MINIDDFQAVFFDLDGTITDPKEGIINSVLYAAKQFGFEETDVESLNEFIGPPLHHSFQKRYGVNEEESFKMVDQYRVYYADKGIYECYLYDGIEDTLSALFEKGVFLSLATSKPVFYADKLLVHFGLDKYFSFTAGSEMDGSRTDKKEVIQFALDNIPPFEKEEILMIGDREFDILGGQHHGLKTAWAKWGYGTDGEILVLKPDTIINKPLELIE